LESDILEFAVAFVLVQELRSRVIGDVDVEPSGIVEIRPDNTQAVIAIRVIDSGALRHIGESSVSVVMEKRIPRALQSTGPTLDVQSPILTVGRLAKTGQIVEMKINIVGDHEIGESISVIISERGAGRPAAVGNASFGGHI